MTTFLDAPHASPTLVPVCRLDDLHPGDVAIVVSPLHKQAFDLRTGRCLDDPDVALDTYTVDVVDGVVHVGVPQTG